MKILRTALGVAVTVALAAGYAASQWAALRGASTAYTEALANLPLNSVALTVLVAAVAFAVVRSGEGEEEK